LRIIKYSVVVLLALFLHLYLSSILKNLDYILYDTLMSFNKNSKEQTNSVVIVDIDNASLKKFGQWPWPRIVNAKLIGQISLFHPSAIGVNIIFSEKDRTSPVNIQHFYEDFFNYKIEMPSLPIGLEDNDLLLTKSLEESHSTLSIYLSQERVSSSECFGLERHGYKFSNISTSLRASFALCNHPNIQNSIKSLGFVNAEVDSDGLFRRMPLFINYYNQLIPSFALATLLNIDTLRELKKENSFSILGHTITMDRDSYVLLNFNATALKRISAIDILENRVAKEMLQGKVILIGSSATGIENGRLLSNHEKASNTTIHATLIENILNDELIVQPVFYKEMNLYLSFLLSLIMVFFLYKRWYILIFLFFSLIMTLSTIWVTLFFFNHIYISIGYLWFPFLSFFFIMSVSFILLNVKEQKKAYLALLESHSATVDSMTRLATIHDDETGAHILRTKNYVKLLAEYFYNKKMYSDILTPDYINSIYEAAPLHDIGKIGIPDAILKKPGKLTEGEFEIMKTHVLLGRNVIKNTLTFYDKNDFLKVAYNIAFYHHEKWDGSGYPNGLKGDEIPIEAQFMTLGDVYDALISKRRYKKAFSFEEAERIIIEAEGRSYSPELIKAFIQLKEKFREIALKYTDE
jgi:adenylate cyclase